MSADDARARAVPTETDIAFAKAVRTRRTGPDPETVAAVPVADVATPGDSSEMSALRAELAQLRSIVMSQNKAPTNARRIGEVADAELAAEAASADLALFLDEALERVKRDRDGKPEKDPDGEILYAKEDRPKIAELRAKTKELNGAVDVARAMAGLIPRTHPGLRRLPANHPVFGGR